MNTDKYDRVTVVLEKDTSQALRYVAKETGVSLSELVRGLLEQPAAWMRSTVAAARSGDPAQRVELLESLDLFVTESMADLDRARMGL